MSLRISKWIFQEILVNKKTIIRFKAKKIKLLYRDANLRNKLKNTTAESIEWQLIFYSFVSASSYKRSIHITTIGTFKTIKTSWFSRAV